MEDKSKTPANKIAYRGPDVIEVGGVAALTTGTSSPNREGLNVPGSPLTYYNANPPDEKKKEVDLGDL